MKDIEIIKTDNLFAYSLFINSKFIGEFKTEEEAENYARSFKHQTRLEFLRATPRKFL